MWFLPTECSLWKLKSLIVISSQCAVCLKSEIAKRILM